MKAGEIKTNLLEPYERAIKMVKFEEILKQFKRKELTSVEAAELLGMSCRTFLRHRIRYDEEGGSLCQFDKRAGRRSGRMVKDEISQALTYAYEEKYKALNVSVRHFYSLEKTRFRYSYSWFKNTLEKAGLIHKTTKGGKHRKRRPRKPMEGMMLHQDGSTHLWIKALGYNIDLIVTMDDATSEIVSAFFVLQEGRESTFRGLYETITRKGLFCSFYTDRGSHYAYTRKAGEKVDKTVDTQVQRALKELNIRAIHAYSPQARGRSERMFRTLQGRLPQEIELNKITTIEAANRFLKEDFMPRFNKEFMVEATLSQSVYIPWNGAHLNEILCVKDERFVRKDNTISYNNLILQIPPSPYRSSYINASVEVRAYMNQSIGIFYGHQNIGVFNSDGDCMSGGI